MESQGGSSRRGEQPLTSAAEHPPPSFFSPSPAGVANAPSGEHLPPPPPSFTGWHAAAMLSPSPAAAPPLLQLGSFSGGPIFPGPMHPPAFGALSPPVWQASSALPGQTQGANAGLPDLAGAPATFQAADDLIRRRGSVTDFYSLRGGGGRGGGGSSSSPSLGVAGGRGGRGVAATMRGGGRGRGVTAAARARAMAAHGGGAAPGTRGGRARGRPPSGAATPTAAGSDLLDGMEEDGSMASPGQAAAAAAAAATTTAATAAVTAAARAAAAPADAGGHFGGGAGAVAATPAGSNEVEGGSVAAVVEAAAVAASVRVGSAAELGAGAAGSTAAAAGSGGRSPAPSARARAAAEAAMLKAADPVLQLIIKEVRTTGKNLTSLMSEVAAVKAVAMLVLGKAEQSALSSDAALAAVGKVGGTVDDVLEALTVGGSGPHPLASVPTGSAGAAADGSDADVIEAPWADAIQKLVRDDYVQRTARATSNDLVVPSAKTARSWFLILLAKELKRTPAEAETLAKTRIWRKAKKTANNPTGARVPVIAERFVKRAVPRFHSDAKVIAWDAYQHVMCLRMNFGVLVDSGKRAGCYQMLPADAKLMLTGFRFIWSDKSWAGIVAAWHAMEDWCDTLDHAEAGYDDDGDTIHNVLFGKIGLAVTKVYICLLELAGFPRHTAGGGNTDEVYRKVFAAVLLKMDEYRPRDDAVNHGVYSSNGHTINRALVPGLLEPVLKDILVAMGEAAEVPYTAPPHFNPLGHALAGAGLNNVNEDQALSWVFVD